MEKKATPKNCSSRWSFRVTKEEEQVKINELFVRSGMRSKSDFIRGRIFGTAFTVKTVDVNIKSIYDELSCISYELSKIGSNVNQIAKMLNTYTSLPPSELHKSLNSLFSLKGELIDTKQRINKSLQALKEKNQL